MKSRIWCALSGILKILSVRGINVRCGKEPVDIGLALFCLIGFGCQKACLAMPLGIWHKKFAHKRKMAAGLQVKNIYK